MGYEVDGVEVGGPRPSWAEGENNVLPQDVATVIYPNDLRVTDGQLEADRNLDTHPKAGEFDSPAEEAAAEVESTSDKTAEQDSSDGAAAPADPPADSEPSAEDPEPPVESTADSAT